MPSARDQIASAALEYEEGCAFEPFDMDYARELADAVVALGETRWLEVGMEPGMNAPHYERFLCIPDDPEEGPA